MTDDDMSTVDEQPGAVELDEHTRTLLEELATARKAVKAWSEAEQKARDQIEAYLALNDAQVGTIDGQPAVARTTSTRQTLDAKALREYEPFLYDAYLRTRDVVTIRLVAR